MSRIGSCVYASKPEFSNGGGIHVARGAKPLITSSTIQNNTALTHGGGFYATSMGSTPTFRDSRVQCNNATRGGGGYVDGGASCLHQMTFIMSNWALRGGGDILILSDRNETHLLNPIS